MEPQLRASLFPGLAPLVNFLPLGCTYSPPGLDLAIPWHLLAPCSNPLLLDCLAKAGFLATPVTQVSYRTLTGHIWDNLGSAARATLLLHLTSSSKMVMFLLTRHQEDGDILCLGPEVKVNRLPGTRILTSKLKLAMRHRQFQLKFGKEEWNFIPETFCLSEEREEVVEAMVQSAWREDGVERSDGVSPSPRSVWIVKPTNLSRGRGIFLAASSLELPGPWQGGQQFLAQRYLSRPALIKGHKFDMRVYILLTGVNPLRVFIYRDGVVRVATEPYEDSEQDLTNRQAHITNIALTNPGQRMTAESGQDVDQDFLGGKEGGSFGFKSTVKSLSFYLRSQGVDWDSVWRRVEEVCVKTVLLGHRDMQEAGRGLRSSYSCYKLLGFDIILDSDLRPWVLEVNTDPDLTPDCVDFPVKSQLIPDMFNILGFHLPQDVAEANDDNLRKAYPNIASFGHNPSAYAQDNSAPDYARLTDSQEDNQEDGHEDSQDDWSDDFLTSCLESGNLIPLHLNTLRQAEQELHLASTFTRLLPGPVSDRFLGYMSPASVLDRLLQVWEKWKMNHMGALSILM